MPLKLALRTSDSELAFRTLTVRVPTHLDKHPAFPSCANGGSEL